MPLDKMVIDNPNDIFFCYKSGEGIVILKLNIDMNLSLSLSADFIIHVITRVS